MMQATPSPIAMKNPKRLSNSIKDAHLHVIYTLMIFCICTAIFRGEIIGNIDKRDSLDTRVILDNVLFGHIGVPVGASLVDAADVLEGSNLRLALDKLHGETLIGVPGDVAVHEPSTGVVGDEGNGSPSVLGKHDNVTTRVVGGLEGGVVVGTGTCAEDPEVVTVKVERVGLGKVGLDEHGHPDVSIGQSPDVLGIGPRGVVLGDSHDGRVVPLRDERLAVHGPLDGSADGQGSLLVILAAEGADIDGQVRDKVRGILISARVVEVVRSSGRLISGGGVVADNAKNVVNVVVVRAGLLRNGAHPEVAGGLGGGDNDVVTLAHTDGDVGGRVGGDGDEVAGDDLHGVVVDGEAEVGVSSTVHKAHAVAGAGNKVNLEALANSGSIVVSVGVGSVDEAVLGLVAVLAIVSDGDCGGEMWIKAYSWWAGAGSFQSQDSGSLLRPVVQEDVTEIHVVVCSRRAVDDDTTKDTIPGLNSEVRVVPG